MSKKTTQILTSIALTSTAILALSGCNTSIPSVTTPKNPHVKPVHINDAPQAKYDAFKIKQREVGLSTRNDPKYHSPMVEVKAQNKLDWFNNQMYRLWDRQITRSQYIEEGIAQFPNHKYEFTFIAHGF